MPQKQPEKNMCDGCQRGLPLEDGLHKSAIRADGIAYGWIVCTKDRYISLPEKKEWNLEDKDVPSGAILSVNGNGERKYKLPSSTYTDSTFGTQPPVSEWEDEWHEKIERFCVTDTSKEVIKSFIARVRNQALEEAVAGINYKLEKATGKTKYHDGWREGLSAGISIIRSLKTND